MGDCKETNVPSVNEDAIKCDHLHSTNCVLLEEAVPCLQAGKGSTLTELFKRLCANLSKTMVSVVEGDGVDVTSSIVNSTTTYTVSAEQKDVFYEEVENDIDIVSGATLPGPDQYFFPSGYSSLEYENTSTAQKKVEVHVSYNTDIPISPENNSLQNKVDGAIIKTDTTPTDTVEYENIGTTDIQGNLYDTVDNNVVDGGTSETVTTQPSGNPVEFRFTNRKSPKNNSFFKIVTLNPNEKVSLKFKSQTGLSGRLLKAQILVKEL